MSRRAALFDLDGTLLDTLDDLADSMNAALAGLGFPTHPVEPYKQFVGDGVEHLAQRALPGEARNEENVLACVAAMREQYAERWAAKTRPYDGVVELLSQLRQRGVRTAVLSNKPDDFTVLMVGHYFADAALEVVRGARPGVPKKPHPAGALAVAETMGLDVSEFLYVGDTNTDMQTATSAGMFAVGVTWGFRSAAELQENGADALIDHPSQLLELL
jgi:phosphoglycolate phosphatase